MTVVQDYQAQTEALADGTAAQVLAVWAAVQAGQINTAEAGVMITAVIALANAAATSLADAYVSAAVEEVTGIPAPAVGLPPVDDFDRLAQAVDTVFGDLPQATDRQEPAAADNEPRRPNEPEDTVLDDVPQATDKPAPEAVGDEPEDTAAVRLERLARSEPLATAQRVTVEVMAEQPKVIGWRRVLDADPCKLCVWLYANGRIYKPTTRFRQHPNCNCQPDPVIETKEKQPA
ncbi:MAG: hypothetical protein R2742_16195 [Micropruina glycogenica]